MTLHCRFLERIEAIDPSVWDEVAPPGDPFTGHSFLAALEHSGAVSAQTGWQPRHLVVEDGQGLLLAALPLYLKQHSWGEYVFDWQWAEAYQRHGHAYYPKLVSAIPFTPATGTRLRIRPGIEPQGVWQAVRCALDAQAAEAGASGWHVLFPSPSELDNWLGQSVLHRLGCQFHWFNRGYRDFDDFLDACTARRRKEIRRERKRLREQGLRFETVTGPAATEQHWRQFYRFYSDTYLRRSGHSGYLNEAFFLHLHGCSKDNAVLVFASRDDSVLAGALYFYAGDTLYGRYWGADEALPGLHFEACYYQGIEFCIRNGLERFDAGAQGEHKLSRGFEPVLTHSAHCLRHPGFSEAIRGFLEREQQAILQYAELCRRSLPFREGDHAEESGPPGAI